MSDYISRSRPAVFFLAICVLLTPTLMVVAKSQRPDIPITSIGSGGQAATQGRSHWEQFRQTFPFHIQTLAFHKESRTLIVSEPPPHVTLAGLKEVLQQYNPSLNPAMSVETTTVGVDGWVKDILLQLPAMEEGATRDALDAVQQYVFHTTYKAYVMALPAEKSAGNSDKLDLSVSAAEVNKWLFGDSEPLTSIYGGEEQTAAELLSKKRLGVFFSRGRGLVVWSVDRGQPIKDYLVEARQFAIDSDIIIAAVNVGEQLLIVGRERVVPVTVLPPLRTETIALLASVRDDELGQSYERKNLFAGRFKGTEDWAPIYLSPALVDTEYGSLLDITDQLLKGWSNNGFVKYANFDQYPTPPSWSKNWCFDKPLGVKLIIDQGANSVGYNWNTAGVGYTVKSNGREFFAVNRTGSLPITYLPDDQEFESDEIEETGYKCFATFGDPNLARVVQYATLYQIFNKYPLREDPTADEGAVPPPVGGGLVAEARKLINTALVPPLDKLQTLAKSDQEHFFQHQNIFVRIKESFGNEGVERLARMLVNRESVAAETEDELMDAYLETTRYLECRGLLFKVSGVDIGDVKNRYVAASKRSADVWIRTPSIVVSQSLGERATIWGGHNVSAATTRFEPNPSVAAGRVKTRLEGRRVVYEFNPADYPKLQRLVRSAAKMTEGRRITRELLDSVETRLAADLVPPPPPPRPPSNALGTSAEPPPPGPAGRGFNEAGARGWRPEQILAAAPEEARATAAYGDVAALVDKRITPQGFEYTITTADGKVVKAYSTPSAVDALVGLGRAAGNKNPRVAFHLNGFTEGEARGFLYTTDLHLKNSSLTGFVKTAGRGGEPPPLRTTVSDYRLPGVNVGEHSLRLVPEGQFKGLHELTINFDVPPQAAVRPPLKVRLQMFYKNTVAEPTVANLKNSIKEFFSRPVAADSRMNKVIIDLANELRKSNLDAKNLLTIWEEDTSGIVIVEIRRLKGGNGERLRADGKSE